MNEKINSLYLQYSGKIFGICMNYLKNEDDAADIMHETYIVAAKKLHTVRDEAKIEGWLCTVAVNCCKKYLKKCKPTVFSETDWDNLNITPSECNTEQQTIDNVTRESVNKIVDGLPSLQKKVIVGYYYKNFSTKQLSHTLNISDESVRSALHRARQNIRVKCDENEVSLGGFSLAAAMSAIGFATPSTASVVTGAGIVGTSAVIGSVAVKIGAGVAVAAIVVGGGVGVSHYCINADDEGVSKSAYVLDANASTNSNESVAGGAASIDDELFDQVEDDNEEPVFPGGCELFEIYGIDEPGFSSLSYDLKKKIANAAYKVGDWLISDYDGGVTINKYNGNDENIVIPEKIGGKKVVGIGFNYEQSDEYENYLTVSPFKYCQYKTITLPSTLKYISVNGLGMQSSTYESLPLAEKIFVDKNNEYYADRDGVLYTKKYDALLCVPANYHADVFTVPSTVYQISDDAFYCSNIRVVNIPAKVTTFEGMILSQKLEEINVSKKSEYFTSVDGVLYDKNKTTLLTYPSAKKGDTYTVSKGAKLGNSFFYVNKLKKLRFYSSSLDDYQKKIFLSGNNEKIMEWFNLYYPESDSDGTYKYSSITSIENLDNSK